MSAEGRAVRTGSASSLNLSKLIRLDEVEDILGTMMKRLDDQEATILSLQRLSASLLPKAAANDVFESIQEKIVDLNARLDEVQSAATANIGVGREMPAGELAYLNSMNIQQISASLAECARQVEVANSFKEMASANEVKLRMVQNYACPLDMGKSLQQAQQDSSRRLTGVEMLVALKVDRSEMGTLDNLAESLNMYENFKNNTLSTLEQQALVNNKVGDELSDHAKQIQEAHSDRGRLSSGVAAAATKVELSSLAHQLRSVTDMTGLCAAKSSLDELQEIVLAESARITTSENFASSLSEQIKETNEEVSTKATIVENNKRVLQKHYDEAVLALGSDLDTKASSNSLGGVDVRVAMLEAQLEAESARLAVAMRFVDWFTSRGENYEHNLRLVDKHLRNLTTGSNPAERGPYEGQVRFTNAMSESPAAVFGGSGAQNSANTMPTSNIGSSFSHLNI